MVELSTLTLTDTDSDNVLLNIYVDQIVFLHWDNSVQ